jgi:hypothetical protein
MLYWGFLQLEDSPALYKVMLEPFERMEKPVSRETGVKGKCGVE